MANNANNVSAGKPKVTGAVFRAVADTTLPTSTTAVLDNAFKGLGYVDENGVSNNTNLTVVNKKAWGGDTVLTIENGKTDTFRMTLIESLNADVKRAVYGDENVTKPSGETITKVNSKPQKACAWVIDLELRDDAVRRIVIPYGTVTAIGEVKYADSDAIGYNITITATPDASGQTHYEYDA